MRRRTNVFNPKRQVREAADPELLERLSKEITYGGNPEHKRNPGDFGLVPPSTPRRDKAWCDEVGIFRRSEALRLLRSGASLGLISVQERGGFPQNIWSVSAERQPLEAQLENQGSGVYHGYPMPESDPFRRVVLERWERSAGTAEDEVR